ncbi:class I lanthipeptide [Parachitinimonas caeni]|uniref:Class I lanthipeptide n=1 Tax=Parachitinimonas caeni TaxID=3031301 RepID=A0ABT7E331_9NEIS|nr:class I lanthipeptide [Parachitinimonas caeni]MDK2125322.1 class I lanthipeptide [Parachitinimonas caeni]
MKSKLQLNKKTLSVLNDEVLDMVGGAGRPGEGSLRVSPCVSDDDSCGPTAHFCTEAIIAPVERE